MDTISSGARSMTCLSLLTGAALTGADSNELQEVLEELNVSFCLFQYNFHIYIVFTGSAKTLNN